MLKSLEYITQNECYGCGACYNTCPVNCIEMVMNAEGFFEPKIEADVCIGCGKCKQVCIANEGHSNNLNNVEPLIYGLVSEEKLLRQSSSGGAFSMLAEYIINIRGGVVFGAAWNENFLVEHVAAETEQELGKMKLSKYVQSSTRHTFKEVKKFLKADRYVLYTGTPCQIAGLYQYLKDDASDKLITVDLICHGIPSPGIFEKYIKERFGDVDDIKAIEMRKRDGWTSCINVYYKNGEEDFNESKKDAFQLAFHQDLILRKTCYNCKYASVPRIADITIGDFWNVKKFNIGKEFEVKSSVLIANNSRGEALISLSAVNTQYKFQICNLNIKGITVKQLNKNIYTPIVGETKIEKRDKFYSYYQRMAFKEAVYNVLFPHCVGLLLYMSDNYGSCATNYALYKSIEKMGFTPIILNNLVSIKGVSSNFAKKYLRLSSKFFDTGNYKDIEAFCNSYVIGSDQSVRWDFGLVYNNYEWLFMAFAGKNKRKIAYAVSYGPDRKLEDVLIKDMYTQCFERFTDFSVREDFAVNMSMREFGRKADWVIDPVFLIDREEYEKLTLKSGVKFEKPYMLAYLRYYSAQKVDLIRRQAKNKGLKLVVICDAGGFSRLKEEYALDEIVEKPEFVDWLSYYAHAEYVITDSFHGTCFSIIFHKKYVSLMAGTVGRFTSLAKNLGASSPEDLCIYSSENELLELEDIFKTINYDLVDNEILKERKRCLEWLHTALTKDVSTASSEESDELFLKYVQAVKEYKKLSVENSKLKKQ